jgi:hypothetical protein
MYYVIRSKNEVLSTKYITSYLRNVKKPGIILREKIGYTDKLM